MNFRKIPHQLIWIVAAVILLVAGGYIYYLRNMTDEAKIRDVLETLCDIGTKSGEGAAATALKLKSLEKIFAPEVDINLDDRIFAGKVKQTELTGDVVRFRAIFDRVKIGMRDLEIKVEGPEQAEAVFTGSLDGVGKSGGGVGTVSEVRDIFCKLEKIDGDWKINSLSVQNILQK